MQEIKKYTLGKLAGSVWVMSGYLLIIAGILTVYFTVTALGLILIGLTLIFSKKRVVIKPEEKMYCSQLLVMGFFPFGSWKRIGSEDSIFLEDNINTPGRSSLSNRMAGIKQNKYRIYLQNTGEKRKVLLAIFEHEEEAKTEMEMLRKILKPE